MECFQHQVAEPQLHCQQQLSPQRIVVVVHEFAGKSSVPHEAQEVKTAAAEHQQEPKTNQGGLEEPVGQGWEGQMLNSAVR